MFTKRVSTYLVGALFLLVAVFPTPAQAAITPGAALSLSSPQTKVTTTTWAADSGTAVTLSSSLYSASDSAVVFNPTAVSANYGTGTVGSGITGTTYVTIEIVAKFPASQWTSNGSYGMVLGWNGTNCDIWIQGSNIGFNTGGGDIYGFTLDTPTASTGYHTYAFVMTTSATDSNQKIYVDGVKQNLSLLQGTVNTRFFSTDGSFSLARYGTNSSNFYGYYFLRNLRIYLRELSQSEVTNNYLSPYTPTSHSIALTSGLTTAVYRTSSTLQSTSDVDGKVTFFFNSKRIPGCTNIQTQSKVASCTWKPAAVGNNKITAQIVAPGGSLATSIFNITVAARSSRR